MSEKQKNIVERIIKITLCLTEREQERFLDFGDGMAFMARQRTQPADQQERSSA